MSAKDIVASLDGPAPSPIKIGLASLGMGTPAARFVAFSAIGMVFVWAIRPSIAFDASGNPKPLTLLAQPQEDSTPLPWYFLGLLPGAIGAVFL